MHFKEFIEDMRRDLDGFERYWMNRHKADPVNYPLHFSDDNTGTWYEMFMIYMADDEYNRR